MTGRPFNPVSGSGLIALFESDPEYAAMPALIDSTGRVPDGNNHG